MIDITALNRFWAKVDFDGPVPDHRPGLGQCWLWTGWKAAGSGYGMFTLNGRDLGAHVLAWRATHGTVPDGLYVCHHCDTRTCVRPDHLYCDTQAKNMADMVAKGRSARGAKQHLAKLTDEIVSEIRKRYGGGATQTALAAEYGVHQATISSIVRRRTWRHVA